jgi:hypothetical protein
MKRQKVRKAKALAAANRRAYVGLAIGAAAGIALFALVLLVVPVGSPSQMVKAQTVHVRATESALKSPAALAVPVVASTLSPTSTAPREAPSPTVTARAPQPARLSVGFDQLSAFPFEVTDQMLSGTTDAAAASRKTLAQIPAAIKALNDKEVSVKGYMLPMNLQKGGLTTDFLILRNQSMCCYGIPPRITEWVNVRMVGQGVKPIMDEPVTVCGTFHVGDVRQRGDLVGIYSLDAEKLLGPTR